MSVKEMWVYLLAYNLIRWMMAQAARLTDCTPRQISFKHAVQLWIAWTGRGHDQTDDTLCHGLLILIAQQRIGQRPGRVEPRALKRRPNNYPLLTKPRAQARELIRQFSHPKKTDNARRSGRGGGLFFL